MTAFRRGSVALTKRWLWHLRREPAGLLASLAQPVLWLLLFGNLFANSDIVGFVGLPLIFASNALAPLSSMPAWLQVIAKANPMTYTITASRSLILNGIQPQLLLTTAVPLVVFAVLSMLASLVALTRAVR